MNSAKKLRLVEPETLTVDQAKDALQAAEDALHLARAGVSAAVNLWSPPNNHRAMIEERRSIIGGRPLEVTANDAARAEREKLKAFDTAEAAEAKADREFDAAKAALAEAEHVELGDGRKALKRAIEAQAAATAAAEKARATIERARAEVRTAEQRLGAAEAAIEEAKARHLNFMVSNTDNVAGGTREDVRRARHEHGDAADDLQMAQQALEELEAVTAAPLHNERRSAEAVEQAARAVLAADVPRILADLEAATHTYRCKAFCAAYFASAAALRSYGFGTNEANLRLRADGFVNALAHFGEPIQIGSNPFPTGNELFASTLASLMTDSTAPIPEMP